jgi:thymidylate synthase
MNRLDKQYQQLLQDIIDYGVEKKDRTGTGTKSIFGYTIRHKMSDGFPLLTTKKMAWKTMVTELLWFLRGDTNIKYLVDNGCHIWDGDAYKNYCKSHTSPPSNPGGPLLSDNLISVRPIQYTQEEFINKIKTDDEFAKEWGDLGPIYGAQWRNWIRKTTRDEKIVEPGVYETSIDQIQNLINDLKTNPDSRRMMVNAWNVGELDQMVLPPCHYGFQVYTRELSRVERVDDYNSKFENKIEVPFIKVNLGDAIENTIDTSLTQANIPTRAISLMWNQRSVDTFLGLPFNISSYGLLLMMIADEVGMVPDELIGNLGDTHIYLNHIEQAKEQIGREPMELPTVHVRDGIFCSSVNDVILENYNSHPSIKAPLSN